MNDTPQFAERLLRLEAIEAIQALKARYTAFADAKYTPDHQRVPQERWQRAAKNQAGCFTEDAMWIADAAFGGSLTGRTALEDWFTRSPWRFALHFYLAPSFVHVTPDSAEAKWRLWQIAILEDGVAPMLLAGITHETYRHGADGWLIASMRFTELHRVDLGHLPVHLENLMPIAVNDRQ